MQVCKSVKLRMRDRRNGTKSLFLDFWPGYRDPETMELIRRRSLGMYIYANPVNAQQKQYNEIILSKAEAIRCRVFIDVINEKYDFFNQDYYCPLKAEGGKTVCLEHLLFGVRGCFFNSKPPSVKEREARR